MANDYQLTGNIKLNVVSFKMVKYRKVFEKYDIKEFNYLWYKYGNLYHDKFKVFSESKNCGEIWQIFEFLYFCFRFYSSASNKKQRSEIVAFYETQNQKRAVDEIIKRFENNKKYRVKRLAAFPRYNIEINEDRPRFSLRVIFIGIYHSIINYTKLKNSLLKIDERIFSHHFADFLSAYVWVSFFLDVFEDNKPKIVILSNDHNPSNRSLIAVCNILEIKTAYIQHATVSEHVPPLCCDFNYIYGQATSERYENIYLNVRTRTSFDKLNAKIILSGIPKYNINKKLKSKINNAIGIAVNHDDPINEISKLLNEILKTNVRILLRYHPSQSTESIEELKFLSKNYLNVELIDPISVKLGEYLGMIDFQVAGNSGIHLDATTHGISSYYYQFNKEAFEDIYGFIEKELIRPIKNGVSIIELVEGARHYLNTDAIRYFDHLFNTKIIREDYVYEDIKSYLNDLAVKVEASRLVENIYE